MINVYRMLYITKHFHVHDLTYKHALQQTWEAESWGDCIHLKFLLSPPQLGTVTDHAGMVGGTRAPKAGR